MSSEKKLYIFKIESYTHKDDLGFRMFKEYKIDGIDIPESLKKNIDDNIHCISDGIYPEVILPDNYSIDHYETIEKDGYSMSKTICSVLY